MKQANSLLTMLLKLSFLAACFLATTSFLPFQRFWQVDTLKPFTEWFQINWQGQVVGWSKFSFDETPSHYVISHEEHFEGRVRGKRMKFSYQYSWEFSKQSPYRILQGNAVLKEPGLIMTTHFENGDQLTITQQRNERRNIYIEKPINYTLSNLLARRQFIESQPNKGSSVRYAKLDPHSLDITQATFSVLAVPNHRHKRYLLTNQASESELLGLTYDVAGNALKRSRGRGIELIASNKKPSFNPEMQTDLYASNGLKVLQPIGELEAIRELKLSMQPSTTDWLQVHPSASLEGNIITTQRASAYKAELNLISDWKFSPVSEKVRALMPAVTKAQNRAQTVKQLLTFTHNYLYYKATPTNFSIDEVIDNGYGDCTEYTQLMLALLNVAKIPARSVVGYIYLGDQEQQFGGHEWVEVLIDGQWRGVDPTWSMIQTTAGHLPISLRRGKSASDLVFAVEQIHYN
ncbi:hypothetical protein GCM10009123_18920 [Kangiella japonica]|uniref:Transglutaminase-like domain-containing protein n=1 Tax=Kangiella japonica TaxID=647384 RepID=A0ABN0T428_9GAMM